jgi:hypothetical protein
MYVSDLTHLLHKSGAIGSVKGLARAMAQFQVDAVTHASGAIRGESTRRRRQSTAACFRRAVGARRRSK